MNERVRVLAVIEASTITGNVKNLLEFCTAVREVDPGIDMHLATYRRGSGETDLLRAARARSIPITAIPERGAFDRAVIGALEKLVAELSPHVLQTHAVKSHFLVRLSGLWRRSPWVAFHHGYTAESLKMRAYNELDRWSLRRPLRLVTVSRAFEVELIRRGVDASRITVLQNAVDPAWIESVKAIDAAEVRRGLGFSADDEVIIAAGRMSHEKAHIDLVRAFRILRQRRPQARLLLAGDGPERKALEEAAAGEPVVFTGHVPSVAPYYAIADVMALPSLSEGSPNVLLEAMACRVPAVATATGGTPEIVTDEESALLVRPREPQELADALERVLADRQLARRLTEQASQLIAQRHAPRARAVALARLYRELVNGPQGVSGSRARKSQGVARP